MPSSHGLWCQTQAVTGAVHGDADPTGRPPPRTLRVAYVNHCARLSGGELALLRLLPALGRVEAHVVLAEDGPLVAELAEVGAHVAVLEMEEGVRRLPKDRVRSGARLAKPAAGGVRYAARLARHLRRLDVDLVHTNSLKAALYGGVAGRMAGLPVVWHIRDRIAGDYLPATAVHAVRALVRWVPHAVIVNSTATRATLGRGATSAAVHVVYDTVVIPPPRPAPPPEPFTVGIVGRIAQWKGHDLFLRAFAAAFPGGPERAVVLGTPLFEEHDYETSLHQLATELGIAARVDFLGFRRDVDEQLARMHALVHASLIPEPFGQVVTEGMAAGLPVLATDAGGPAEIVTHGVDGLLYRMGDKDALAAALSLVRGDPPLRARLGAAAIERARRFAPEVIAGEVCAVYDTVVRPRRRARRGSASE